jgi:hydroxyacylglutathione hydrolase
MGGVERRTVLEFTVDAALSGLGNLSKSNAIQAQMKSHIRSFAAGAVIFHEGAPGSEFYIIISGAVAIRKAIGGTDTHLATLTPGSFFGEMAVLDHYPRSATAIAVESDTTLMAVDTARFIYLVSQQPAFAMLIMEILSKRQRNRLDGSLGAGPTIVTDTRKKLCEPVRIDDNCFQLRSHSRSGNAYLFKGNKKNVLVDTALPSGAEPLANTLRTIGFSPSEIDIIVLTHEHFDHTGAVPSFGGLPTVAAYPLAANKINLRDEFATLECAFGEKFTPFEVNWEIVEGTVIDTGFHRLRVVHTPGHSSGGISLVDENSGWLISGDTILKGGPIGGVFGSGNISDMIYSLKTLKGFNPTMLLPGHGPLSSDPKADIALTLERCSLLLDDSKLIFDALQANESVNLIINSYKDLNRKYMRDDFLLGETKFGFSRHLKNGDTVTQSVGAVLPS